MKDFLDGAVFMFSAKTAEEFLERKDFVKEQTKDFPDFDSVITLYINSMYWFGKIHTSSIDKSLLRSFLNWLKENDLLKKI